MIALLLLLLVVLVLGVAAAFGWVPDTRDHDVELGRVAARHRPRT